MEFDSSSNALINYLPGGGYSCVAVLPDAPGNVDDAVAIVIDAMDDYLSSNCLSLYDSYFERARFDMDFALSDEFPFIVASAAEDCRARCLADGIDAHAFYDELVRDIDSIFAAEREAYFGSCVDDLMSGEYLMGICEVFGHASFELWGLDAAEASMCFENALRDRLFEMMLDADDSSVMDVIDDNVTVPIAHVFCGSGDVYDNRVVFSGDQSCLSNLTVNDKLLSSIEAIGISRSSFLQELNKYVSRDAAYDFGEKKNELPLAPIAIGGDNGLLSLMVDSGHSGQIVYCARVGLKKFILREYAGKEVGNAFSGGMIGIHDFKSSSGCLINNEGVIRISGESGRWVVDGRYGKSIESSYAGMRLLGAKMVSVRSERSFGCSDDDMFLGFGK